MPKYLNSAETPLFHKGSTVYGLHQAQGRHPPRDRVVVVEGYLDVIALAQHGIGYAVAILGTALTSSMCARSRATPKTLCVVRRRRCRTQGAARSFEISSKPVCSAARHFCPRRTIPNLRPEAWQGRCREVARSSGAHGRFLFSCCKNVLAAASKARARLPARWPLARQGDQSVRS